MGSFLAPGTRALIAQQLSVLYAMLGAPQDSRQWLFRSCPQSSFAMAQEGARVRAAVDRLPLKRAPTPLHAVPNGKLRLYLLGPKPGHFLVASEPLTTGLQALAHGTVDFYRLRRLGALAGMPEPWPTLHSLGSDDGWRMFKAPTTHGVFLSSAEEESVWRVEGAGALAAADILSRELYRFNLILEGVPEPAPASARYLLSGSTPELGEWSPERAIPLRHRNDQWGNRWKAEIHLCADRTGDPARYRYLYAPRPGRRPCRSSARSESSSRSMSMTVGAASRPRRPREIDPRGREAAFERERSRWGLARNGTEFGAKPAGLPRCRAHAKARRSTAPPRLYEGGPFVKPCRQSFL